MNPEERFDRIEKAIEAQNQQIDKNTAGIRDLIRASSIFLEQQKTVSANIQALAENQKEADERMTALRQMQEDTWKMIRDGDEKFGKLSAKLDRVADILEGFLKGLRKPNGSQ